MKYQYKIVAVTPAGRKEYLEILHKHICKNKHILDRWDIWVNTNNQSDIDYINNLAEADSFINLIQAELPYNGNLSIYPFWKHSVDEDTIYVRFDDDIVYIHDDTIENLIDFRIKNKEYFFIYPYIINNIHHSKDLQLKNIATSAFGQIRSFSDLEPRPEYGGPEYGKGIDDHVALRNSAFARHLHELFIEKYNSDMLSDLMTTDEIIWERFPQVSINCVSWFGSTFKTFNGILENADEERWLTTVKAKEMDMLCCTAPNTLVSHFLYGPQRSNDSMLDILVKYKDISNV